MKQSILSRILPFAAILLIVAFQSYWVIRLYKEEAEGLKKETNAIFREVVYNMQMDRFKKDTLIFKRTMGNNLFAYDAVNAIRRQRSSNILVSNLINPNGSRNKVSGKVFARNDSLRFTHGKQLMQIYRGKMPMDIAEMLERKNGMQIPGISLIDTMMLKKMNTDDLNVIVNVKKHPPDSLRKMSENNSVSIEMKMDKDNSQGFTFQPGKGITDSNSIKVELRNENPISEKTLIRMITDGKALEDSIAVPKLDSAYKKELLKANIPLSFVIKKGLNDSQHKKDTALTKTFVTNSTIVGFIKPMWYQAEFESPSFYLLKKISLPLIFSLFLIAFTTVTIVFLYKNIQSQRKLTEMKNDFISNITHELKTPIATVNVAIEALRNFGGLDNPVRTKEYLDISAAELQRLSLLVDKVLKLSLFEKQAIALQKENFDLLNLVNEVMGSMKLQFENKKTFAQVESKGENFVINADKLHIASVLYNLLDNALKYSKEHPRISVNLVKQVDCIEIIISDNGIGIPVEYRTKIFDQFFRVPSGDRHNSKGYGLGLSYVKHIIQLHHGIIEVDSELDIGTVFTVKLPINEKGALHFENGRKMQKDIFQTKNQS